MIKHKIVCKVVIDKNVLKHLVFFGKPLPNKKMNEQKQKKSRKLWSAVFLIVNLLILGIVLWTQLKSDGGIQPLSELLENNINFYYLLLGLLCFVICVMLETSLFEMYIKKLTLKRNVALAYKGYSLGKYYDLITPFAIGGQPFMMYYFSKRGLKASQSITVVGARYIAHTLSFCVLAVIVMCGGFANVILSSSVQSADLIFAKTMAWIGLGVNVLLLSAIILISINKKIMQKLLIGLIWILKKLHITKKPDLLYVKISRTLLSYQNSMKQFFTTKSTAFISLGIKIFVNFFHYSVPFFVYSAFSGFDISLWFAFVSAGIMIDLAANSLPVPGGSGVAEMSFTAFFGGMFLAGTTFWALLLWRILTYYLYILQGGIVMIFDFIFGNRKQKNK